MAKRALLIVFTNPLEPAKLPYNSISSAGLTPNPSWVTALPVMGTKNCWANFREEFRLWLSALEWSCWGHCRGILSHGVLNAETHCKKSAAGNWVEQFPLLRCSGSPWTRVPGRSRALQAHTVLLPHNCLGHDKVRLLLQGLCYVCG